MTAIPQTDRRFPHWHSQQEANRLAFHPDPDADTERRRDLARLDEWIAELHKEQNHEH